MPYQWKTISEKIVHENKWWKVIHKKFETPEKASGDYFVIDTPGSSMVIPVKDNKIIFAKGYRYIPNKWVLGLPGGGRKEKSTSVSAAKEELEEETGFKAGKIKKIGTFMPMAGICSEVCSVFLATDLKYVGSKHEDTEKIKHVDVEITEVYKMLDNGKFLAGMTMSSLSLARKYLLK